MFPIVLVMLENACVFVKALESSPLAAYRSVLFCGSDILPQLVCFFLASLSVFLLPLGWAADRTRSEISQLFVRNLCDVKKSILAYIALEVRVIGTLFAIKMTREKCPKLRWIHPTSQNPINNRYIEPNPYPTSPHISYYPEDWIQLMVDLAFLFLDSVVWRRSTRLATPCSSVSSMWCCGSWPLKLSLRLRRASRTRCSSSPWCQNQRTQNTHI